MCRTSGAGAVISACMSVAIALPASAQAPVFPVTRDAAVAAALDRGSATLIARADTSAARAGVIIARAFPNPTLSASATRATPQLHALIDLPLDVPWIRSPRIQGAQALRTVAGLQFAYTRATVRYDVEVAYGSALAAAERAALSARAARDADSLHTLARVQRDAGGASDLDVELALINADQQANAALGDSLAAIGALLDLQVMMGLEGDAPRITLADSLPVLLHDVATPHAGLRGVPLPVAAAEANVTAQERALTLARRRAALVPSLQLGFEGRDPSGSEPGVLPVIGLAIPLPILSTYRGDIALAAANRQRAAAELTGVRRDASAAIARADRELAVAAARLARDARLVSTGRIVAAKSVTAYAEGAASLADVLQAQRSARDAFAQYVTDAIAASNAAAAVRLVNASTTPP